MNKIVVLHIPAWYPSVDQPQNGIFVKEHVRSVATNTVSIVSLFKIDNNASKLVSIVEEEPEDGIEYITVSYKRLFPGAGKLFYPYAFMRLMRYLKKKDLSPRIVHGHVYMVGAPLILAKVIYRKKVAITEHFTRFVNGELSWRHRLFARIMFLSADRVLPVSTMLEKAILEVAPGARTTVVPNVVELDLFKPVPIKKRAKRFVAIGTVIPRKGFDRAITEFAKFNSKVPGYELDIVGAIPNKDYLKELKSQALRLGVGKAVHFRGLRQKPEVAKIIAGSVGDLVSSKCETFGLNYIESLAAAVPIISTNVGIASEMVASGIGGVYITKDNFKGAAEFMKKVVSEDVSIDPKILRRYSMDSVGKQLLGIYQEILS